MKGCFPKDIIIVKLWGKLLLLFASVDREKKRRGGQPPLNFKEKKTLGESDPRFPNLALRALQSWGPPTLSMTT